MIQLPIYRYYTVWMISLSKLLFIQSLYLKENFNLLPYFAAIKNHIVSYKLFSNKYSENWMIFS